MTTTHTPTRDENNDPQAVATQREWWADGHVIFADSAENAHAEVKRLYEHDAQNVRPAPAPGDAVTFTLHGTDEYAAEFDGQTVTVIRPLDSNNPADNLDEEVGPMYRLRALDGREFDAFADELTAVTL